MTEPQGMDVVREVLPARVRRVVYAAYVIVGVIVTAVAAGFAFAGDVPTWVGVTMAVMGSLTIPMAALAVVNTKAP